MKIDLWISYLNQLKEKRPLERGTIQSTVPFLLKQCVWWWKLFFIVASKCSLPRWGINSKESWTKWIGLGCSWASCNPRCIHECKKEEEMND